jgi:predicted double-glycine peptidase
MAHDGLSGTGGGLRYLVEVSTPNMVNQATDDSCTAACVRQLLKDASLDFGEPELAARIGVVVGFGSTAGDAARILDELHPRFRYAGGAMNPDVIRVLCGRDPWIAFVKTDRRTIYSVIVDGLRGDAVDVRDPWGLGGPGSESGTRATIRLADFLEHWHWAVNNLVYPYRLK